MKLLLDVKDSKADFVMELLKNLPYVKTKTLTPAKAKFIDEFRESVEFAKKVERGEIRPKKAKDLLNEL